MLDFTKLWDKTYLFGPNPVDLSRSDLISFWVLVVFMAAGIVAKIIAIKKERGSPAQHLFSRFFHLFFSIGGLLLVWMGFRYENIPWLGSHFLALLLLLIWLLWLVFIGKYYIREFKSKQQRWQEEKIKQKYMQRK